MASHESCIGARLGLPFAWGFLLLVLCKRGERTSEDNLPLFTTFLEALLFMLQEKEHQKTMFLCLPYFWKH